MVRVACARKKWSKARKNKTAGWNSQINGMQTVQVAPSYTDAAVVSDTKGTIALE